jgi:hypothetical protein
MKRLPPGRIRTHATLLAVGAMLCLSLTVGAIAEGPSPLATAGKGLLHGATIVHRSLAQLGHEAQLDVEYVPDEGGLVHMKDDPGEADERRHIRLETSVEFLFDWENQLPAGQVRNLVGFGLPQPGPVKGVPVRWYFPKNLIKFTELHADDWDGVLPTWWNYTDESGVARAHLYLLADQPLGGVRKVLEGEVRVMAKVQKGIALNPAALGLGIGEELFQPTEAFATIRIERHNPTEWEGEITIDRTVTGIAGSSHTYSDGLREDAKEFNMWDGTMHITNIRLNTEGAGSGDYTFQVYGNCDRHVTVTYQAECQEGVRQTFTGKADTTRSGFGKESGTAPVQLRVDPRGPSYSVSPAIVSTGIALQTGFSGEGTEKRQWTDCTGTHTEERGAEPYPNDAVIRAFQLSYTVPHGEWPSFDPDAPALSGFAVWNSDVQSTDGAVTYSVVTSMRWNLRRVYK